MHGINMNNKFTESVKKTLRTFINILPIVFGMLLLTSLAVSIFPEQISSGIFGQNNFIDALIGASVGSVAAGHPLASYVLAGELLAADVGMFAVTALIVSWVTVGIVQLPAEALLLGKQFALYRNLLCFIFAIAISLLTTYTLQLVVG
jgi:uncharacterized membrane protein YraQ (UPF0718 family)